MPRKLRKSVDPTGHSGLLPPKRPRMTRSAASKVEVQKEKLKKVVDVSGAISQTVSRGTSPVDLGPSTLGLGYEGLPSSTPIPLGDLTTGKSTERPAIRGRPKVIANVPLNRTVTIVDQGRDEDIQVRSTLRDELLHLNGEVNNQPNESPRYDLNSDTFVNGEPRAPPSLNLPDNFNSSALRDRSLFGESSRYVHRMTTAKSLPSFSGNPLEWAHFKEAFARSTELGQYDDWENFSRLMDALKGDAREAVKGLLISSRNTSKIIKTLDLHYGNKRVVAKKLTDEIKETPALTSGKISLIQFATRVTNIVSAIQSLELTEYVSNRDVADAIVEKLPATLIFAYNHHARRAGYGKPELLMLGEFLYDEAECAAERGHDYVEGNPANKTVDRKTDSSRKNARTSNHAYAMTSDGVQRGSAASADKCIVCKRAKNHALSKCYGWQKLRNYARWQIVKDHALCFKCLKPGHRKTECAEPKCSNRGGEHNTLLHNFNPKNTRPATQKADEIEIIESVETSRPTASVNSASLREDQLKIIGEKVLLKIMPIRVIGKSGVADTYAFLDEGSTITLISKEIANLIGEKGRRTTIEISGINGAMDVDTEKICVRVQGVFGSFQIKNALVLEKLNLPIQSLSEGIAQRIAAKTGIVGLQGYDNARPQILLGQDNWELIVTQEYARVAKPSVAVSRCLLGWVVHGLASRGRVIPRKRVNVTTARETTDEEDSRASNEIMIDNMMKEFFEIENVGVNPKAAEEYYYERAEQILKSTTVFKGGHWETGLLWSEDRAPETDGFATARRRLTSLEKRLDRDAEYAKLYYREMERLIDEGYAKTVDVNTIRTRKWFLPHFGVVNINKPGKLRLVFDAAARTQGVSFNDQMNTGPDLLKSLPGILIRFRRFAVAFKGDIKDMFLRVRVREDDQNAQLFLYRGTERRKAPRVYRMTRLIFGAKSSPCSAIHVKNANASRFEGQYPEAARSLANDCYMDDFISSAPSEDEAIAIMNSVITINQNADFQMHAWASNRPRVLEKMGMDSTATSSVSRLGNAIGERVLGLVWDETNDTLNFDLSFRKIQKEILAGELVPTKRQVLSVMMSVFDPLGLITPHTLKTKLLMQAIWRSGIRWDQPLREEEVEEWRDWLTTIERVKEVSIPRCMLRNRRENGEAELHVFCDASQRAYGAVAYLRTKNQKGEVYVSIIMSRAKVVPLKGQTIPRLELQAALVGAKLSSYIETQLEIKLKRKCLWSDSTTVIAWIRGEPRTRQVFVANRLHEIKRETKASEWRWLPTSKNPADHLTRVDRDIAKPENAWFAGPGFLKEEDSEWPQEQTLSPEELTHIDELEKRKAQVAVNFIAVQNAKFSLHSRLLGWSGLLNVARRVRRIAYKWQGKPMPEESLLVERQRLEEFWIRDAQSDTYNAEIINLKRGKEIQKSSKIIKLTPYLDDEGLLRANGRATELAIEGFNNYPIILDGKHYVAQCILKQLHTRYFHANSGTVINEIRQKYNITGVRERLKSLTAKCIGCKLRRGKPNQPLMSALPASRVAHYERPFTHCGIDYFGPMTIKIGRRREKRWGVLCTCLTTRAIHLEIACSLTAGSALMAVQRLAARRGTPRVMYSDNGTNFRAACKELKDAIAQKNKQELESRARVKGIEWRFNPPQAPHTGGAWERLIRSVKTALKSALHEQVTSEEILYTTLTEIEHCVNSRPLTHVSVDPRDQEALTPNHFLIGSSSGEVRFNKFTGNDSGARNQWRLAQRLADNFWRRWLREYLPTLLERKRWNRPEKPVEIGDLVLVIDYQLPRNVWSKGVIVRVMPGKDNRVRVAEIRTPHGIVVRSVRRLIVLANGVDVQN